MLINHRRRARGSVDRLAWLAPAPKWGAEGTHRWTPASTPEAAVSRVRAVAATPSIVCWQSRDEVVEDGKGGSTAFAHFRHRHFSQNRTATFDTLVQCIKISYYFRGRRPNPSTPRTRALSQRYSAGSLGVVPRASHPLRPRRRPQSTAVLSDLAA